jgi:hypothetical protein
MDVGANILVNPRNDRKPKPYNGDLETYTGR